MNRATPKTQSALLEAMEECQITVEGLTRQLEQPFFVIGTQNPLDQAGTFPLPESQLDRFMMKLNLGYPDQQAERQLLAGESRHDLLQQLATVMDSETVLSIQQAVPKIHVSEPLLDYVQALVNVTRDNSLFVFGLSPRAALSLLKAARTWALMQDRDFVEPADVKDVFSAVSCHRLMAHEHHSKNVEDLIQDILNNVAIP
jgi:MoxR-like ATPase